MFFYFLKKIKMEKVNQEKINRIMKELDRVSADKDQETDCDSENSSVEVDDRFPNGKVPIKTLCSRRTLRASVAKQVESWLEYGFVYNKGFLDKALDNFCNVEWVRYTFRDGRLKPLDCADLQQVDRLLRVANVAWTRKFSFLKDGHALDELESLKLYNFFVRVKKN